MNDRQRTDSAPLLEAQKLLAAGEVQKATALLEGNVADRACAQRLLEYYIGERDNFRARLLAERLASGSDARALVSRSVLALLDGDPAAAEQASQQALSMDPALAVAYNSLGRALQNAGQSEPALAAFRKAVALDSNYPEAWHNLGHVLRAQGLMADAVEAYRQAIKLAPAYRSAAVNLGITLFNLDQPVDALACFQAVLKRDPGDVEALVNAGLAHHLLGQFDQARHCYVQAIERDQQNATALCYLGILLNEQRDSRGAIQALEAALAQNPGDVEAWAELASAHENDNSLYAARKALSEGLKIAPGHPGLQLEKARLERRNGDAPSAVKTLKSIDPRHLHGRQAQRFFFELGLVQDRVGNYDEAIGAFATGKQLLGRSQRRRSVDPRAFENRCAELEHWLSQAAPGAQPQPDDPGEDRGGDLCFLLGFPRSGSTLLNSFLNAHSGVSSIEDMPTLERVVGELREYGQGYPGALADISGPQLRSLRELYRSEVARFIEPNATLIVDTLPLRLLHTGLIQRLFPQAKILFALRHPCDVVLANFMAQDAENDASVHFDSLAKSAAMYDRVMRLWQLSEAHIAVQVHYARFEDLIGNTEQEIHAICEFLGIDPEPGMFDENVRLQSRNANRTSRYQPTPEPIYRRSSSRWTNYRSHMEPFLPLLSRHMLRYGYSLGLS